MIDSGTDENNRLTNDGKNKFRIQNYKWQWYFNSDWDGLVVMEYLTDGEVAELLRRHISNEFGTLKAAAHHYKVSPAYLSAMQTGKKPISLHFRDLLGVGRVTVWATDE